jgi:Na+-translocating ferredoxin:NAD+ oxidoreductase RnfA subunit
MSCSVTQILDKEAQQRIDDGVNSISAQIKKKLNHADDTCEESQIDKFVAISSIILQYVVFAFILVALASDKYSATVVKVVVITSVITTVLLVIQYRNILISALRILSALETSTKIILVLSLLAMLGTGYIKKGGAGLYLTMGIAAVLFLRLSLQVRDFVRDSKSALPAFTTFLKEVITTKRIQTLYDAFK